MLFYFLILKKQYYKKKKQGNQVLARPKTFINFTSSTLPGSYSEDGGKYLGSSLRGLGKVVILK